MIRIPPKSDVRFSLKSTESDQKYLDAVKQLGDTDELRNILQTAIKNNTLGKAPNGKKSNLEPAQWLMVRTKQFKDWFGDWEKAYKRNYLETIDARTIDVGIFVKDEGKSDKESSYKYFDGSKKYKTMIGEVEIDWHSARDSLAHGYAQKKLDIITGLQKDFKKAIYLKSEKDFDGKNINNHYFAYPVDYDGKRELVFCRVREDNNKNRLYVHEVFTEDEIKMGSIHQTAASALNKKDELHRGTALYRTILKDIYNVNQNEISKVVDENGEPMVVYHGTNGSFNEYQFGRKRKRYYLMSDVDVESQAAFFALTEEEAKEYGSNVKKVYLNITKLLSEKDADIALKPAIYTENGHDYVDINNGIGREEVDADKKGWSKLIYDEDNGIDWYLLDNKEIVDNIKRYADGIKVFENNSDSGYSYAVFSPEQIKQADPVTYDDGNVIPLSKRFDRSSNDIRYSLRSTDKNGKYNNSQDTRAYYQIPFSESIQRVVDPNYKGRDHIFVSETPEVLQKIGFEKLPIMMPLRKLRLNYYNDRDFKNKFGKLRPSENTHGLYGNLSKITEAIKHPIAVLSNFAENAKNGSIVVLTNININGNKVMIPIIIEASTRADGDYIDSHLILTVYNRNDWLNNLVLPAFKIEKNRKREDDDIGIFYWNKEKASSYKDLRQLKTVITTDFLHNINDNGSPVKDKYKKQTETLQFKRWFLQRSEIELSSNHCIYRYLQIGKSC